MERQWEIENEKEQMDERYQESMPFEWEFGKGSRHENE